MRHNTGHEGFTVGEATVVQTREKALLVELNVKAARDTFGFVTKERELWVPLSVIHDDSDVYSGPDGKQGTLIVQRWWAEKEGLCDV